MLRRAHHAGVERVEVHLERIGNVARHHRPLEEMDVVEAVDEARGVVDVLQQRFAVFALLDIDQMHGGARRAVMHARALDHHVVLGVLAVQGEVPRRALDRRQHQRAREADAAVGADGSRRRASAPRCSSGWRWRSRSSPAASARLRGCARGRSRRAACSCRLRGRPGPGGCRRPAARPASPAAPRVRRIVASRDSSSLRPAFPALSTCDVLPFPATVAPFWPRCSRSFPLH